eukprot:COSAG02_NODE_107_length_36312_cov_45.037942_44_plen_148_part_00
MYLGTHHPVLVVHRLGCFFQTSGVACTHDYRKMLEYTKTAHKAFICTVLYDDNDTLPATNKKPTGCLHHWLAFAALRCLRQFRSVPCNQSQIPMVPYFPLPEHPRHGRGASHGTLAAALGSRCVAAETVRSHNNATDRRQAYTTLQP